MTLISICSVSFSLILILLSSCNTIANSSSTSGGISGIDGRYSFSLTTFDPSGKLRQVEYATLAASLGQPILAYYLPSSHSFIFCSPHATNALSPLIHDDGTPRFTQISSRIVLGHSGLGADGRVLIAEAQRIAIQHEYTFGEDFEEEEDGGGLGFLETVLDQLSELMQKYTMKPGVRPFGCSLLIAYLPPISSLDGQKRGKLYRIDPSGAITSCNDGGVGGDGGDGGPFAMMGRCNDVKELCKFLKENDCSNQSVDVASSLLREALMRDAKSKTAKSGSFNDALQEEKEEVFLSALFSARGRKTAAAFLSMEPVTYKKDST
mmetsp:Transcript_49189/g.73129  ORF Transcript_49189/g.73129 Transcript_49189/m.73129 type:complete len:322 (-) Transcript_49189:37-1002(-)|eukprot:CAMPEP_0195511646 /NCGR_PEP_ID=MMETSP0794_2-20130614/3894_1 /TAXON_ID=515487 /ORGANISM="Stephanopyxis turris, Strain CCMP 815" /LENGTH=321 /DNA_ID=CAMNT_0040639295 /DNA_START=247 /DNA_END=1215 /DNA_ORIENTATION=+